MLFLAPARTPRDIVNRMSSEVRKAIESAEINERFKILGIEPVGNKPEEAAKFLDEEIAKWAKVIRVAGFRLEN
jgi:tripartite-type tricarboxylate transporter receptor subunit TctC